MTLLFFDGLQDAVLCKKPEWGGSMGVADVGRDGSASGSARLSSTATSLTVPTSPASWAIGHGLVVRDAGVWAQIQFWGGGVQRMTLLIDTPTNGGVAKLYRGTSTGTLLATASLGAFAASAWRHVQVKGSLHASAGSCEVKVDGETVISYTGQTSAVTSALDVLSFTSNSSNAAFCPLLDDLWVCDLVDGTATDGRPNNDFLGDLVVKTLLPTGAGDQTQLTPSTGANWAAVDEVPVNTSDYVSAVAASGLKDQYAVTDLPANAVTVFGVRTTAYGLKTDAGTGTVKVGVKEGGTVTVSSSLTLATTAGPATGTMLKKRPSNGAVFSVSDVNSMQAAIEAA